MSSNAFEVELRADRPCRRCVLGTGIALGVGGAWLILAANIDGFLQLALLIPWLGDCAFSLLRLWRGFSATERIRLTNAGAVTVIDSAGRPTGVSLASGSIVGRRLGWLSIRWPDDRWHAELLSAANAESLAWHRFQLIWRLGREAFGHPGPA